MFDFFGFIFICYILEGYFFICGKEVDKDELIMEEVIKCLEGEVVKSWFEKVKVGLDDLMMDVSIFFVVL